MPKFELTVSERERDWASDNEALQSTQCFRSTQSTNIDTPGFGKGSALQSVFEDTPGYSAGGDLSPLTD